ncbi:G-type lectin S-receptor-like serine/threonine-protein kinase [Panicum miliaceum]|uniref:G-type lectin S-receptor-like serine/threonine-protein kinase n=1 Tax=Panicum miliaceum TaxID=4540 RepID=A0A3L6Q4B1_PANMI|nr:G-type lectin S-receptor-like serine/threonine-protein kinase [Panicum miliaceum]
MAIAPTLLATAQALPRRFCHVPIVEPAIILKKFSSKLNKLSEMNPDASRGSKLSLLSTLPDELTAEFLKDTTDRFSPKQKLGQGTFGTIYKDIGGIVRVSLSSQEVIMRCGWPGFRLPVAARLERRPAEASEHGSVRQMWTDEHIASKYSSLDAVTLQNVKT